MTFDNWLSLIPAIAALITALAAAFWGQKTATAKDETIKAKDAQIATLHDINEKQAQNYQDQIANLRHAQEENIQARDATIKNKDETIKTKEARIDELKDELKKQSPEEIGTRLIKSKDTYETVLAEANARIAELEAGQDTASETTIAQLKNLQVNSDKLKRHIATLEGIIQNLQQSQSLEEDIRRLMESIAAQLQPKLYSPEPEPARDELIRMLMAGRSKGNSRL